MAFLAKNPLKAKFVIKSTHTDGLKMEERCDNMAQVRGYLKKPEILDRQNVRIYTLTPLSAFAKKRGCVGD